jgi:hypothetical protein
MKWENTHKNAKKKKVHSVSCAENWFYEQDHILSSSTTHNGAQVHNLVGTYKVRTNMSSLNLEQ